MRYRPVLLALAVAAVAACDGPGPAAPDLRASVRVPDPMNRALAAAILDALKSRAATSVTMAADAAAAQNAWAAMTPKARQAYIRNTTRFPLVTLDTWTWTDVLTALRKRKASLPNPTEFETLLRRTVTITPTALGTANGFSTQDLAGAAAFALAKTRTEASIGALNRFHLTFTALVKTQPISTGAVRITSIQPGVAGVACNGAVRFGNGLEIILQFGVTSQVVKTTCPLTGKITVTVSRSLVPGATALYAVQKLGTAAGSEAVSNVRTFP